MKIEPKQRWARIPVDADELSDHQIEETARFITRVETRRNVAVVNATMHVVWGTYNDKRTSNLHLILTDATGMSKDYYWHPKKTRWTAQMGNASRSHIWRHRG